MRHDQSFTVRLPTEILHRLEARLERTKASKTRQPGAPTNVSEAIRHVLVIGLDVLDGGESCEEWMLDRMGLTITNMVASGIADKNAARLLKKIAARAPAEPDFG